MDNPEQHLSAGFGTMGVSLASGKLHLGLRLAEAGYGGLLEHVAAGRPTGEANRVSYRRSWLTEWYANGPLGLEQGFTIPRRPTAGAGAGSTLTLSLAVSGAAHVSTVEHGKGVLFSAGASSLRYDSLVAQDASGHTLPSSMGLHDGRLVLHVDTRGAAYPLHIDPFIQQGSKLTAGEIGAGIFGGHVALSDGGGTALVAATNDSPHNVFREGAVWVFVRGSEGWTQQGEPLTGGGGASSYFGSSVALSANGNTAIIGSDGGGSKAEPAYVFVRSGTKWSLQATVTGSTETSTSHFGSSAALSENGNTAIVGASTEKVGAQEGAGAAYVFTRSGTTWSQQGEPLTGTGETGEGNRGASVALSASGNTALVGGPADNSSNGPVWTFVREGISWSQSGEKLAKPECQFGAARFGTSVAISASGALALVGGPGDNSNAGAAWVFNRAGASWSQNGSPCKLTGGEESGKAEFGQRVALDSGG